MEQVIFMAANIKDDELLDDDNLLSNIFEDTCMTIGFVLQKEVVKNPGRLMIISDIISLKSKITFQNDEFVLDFSKATYKNNCTVHVEICCEKSGMVFENLNMKLYSLKIGLKDCLLRYFKEIYWNIDTQNEEICKELYHKIYFIENKFRHLINTHMIALIGFSWFNKVIHQKYIGKAKVFSGWYWQKKNYKTFKDVQSQLFNLQVTDLISMLKNSYMEVPDKELVHELKQLEKNYKGNLKDILTEEYQGLLNSKSIWEKEFIDIFGADFEDKWNEFGNMRNMIAHNKPICVELYSDIIAMIEELSRIFTTVQQIYQTTFCSNEKQEAEYLYRKYSEEFYMEEAGLNNIPEDENEVLNEITNTAEYRKLTTLFEESKYNIECNIKDLRPILYDIANMQLKKFRVIEIKSMLDVLCRMVYADNANKKSITLQYIEVTNNKKGLEIVFNEMTDNCSNALNYLNSICTDFFYNKQFHLGTIAKIKNLYNDTLEITANGYICIERGSSNTLEINLILNGETIMTGEICKSYSAYAINDEGVSVPINEDGLYVDIREIFEYVEKFTTELDNDLWDYATHLEQFI